MPKGLKFQQIHILKGTTSLISHIIYVYISNCLLHTSYTRHTSKKKKKKVRICMDK